MSQIPGRHALLFVRAHTVTEPTAPRLQVLRQLVAQRRWTVAGEFVATPVRRRERECLLAAIHHGTHGAGVVVVPALSHLGTTIRDVVLVADDLFGRGWDLVCVGEGLDTSMSEGRALIAGTLANLAALDRAGAADRARSALDQTRRAGRQLGRKRREVPLQEIGELLAAGKSWREIARKTGIPSSTLHAAMKRADIEPRAACTLLEAA